MEVSRSHEHALKTLQNFNDEIAKGEFPSESYSELTEIFNQSQVRFKPADLRLLNETKNFVLTIDSDLASKIEKVIAAISEKRSEKI